ncbi:MAG: peptidyl-arginine deiminase, partial [Parabacteroides sp.]
MNKNLNDYPLLELLDVKSLLQTYPIEKRNEAIGEIFDAIAKKLFNEYHIKKGDSTYDFLEIEFYY